MKNIKNENRNVFYHKVLLSLLVGLLSLSIVIIITQHQTIYADVCLDDVVMNSIENESLEEDEEPIEYATGWKKRSSYKSMV